MLRILDDCQDKKHPSTSASRQFTPFLNSPQLPIHSPRDRKLLKAAATQAAHILSPGDPSELTHKLCRLWGQFVSPQRRAELSIPHFW